MNEGLSERDKNTIFKILSRYPEVTEVYLFGSRAKGTFQKGSDIDLAVMNKGIGNDTIKHLLANFQESSLPYFVDIVDYHSIEKKAFKDHIDKVGKLFYKKRNT